MRDFHPALARRAVRLPKQIASPTSACLRLMRSGSGGQLRVLAVAMILTAALLIVRPIAWQRHRQPPPPPLEGVREFAWEPDLSARATQGVGGSEVSARPKMGKMPAAASPHGTPVDRHGRQVTKAPKAVYDLRKYVWRGLAAGGCMIIDEDCMAEHTSWLSGIKPADEAPRAVRLTIQGPGSLGVTWSTGRPQWTRVPGYPSCTEVRFSKAWTSDGTADGTASVTRTVTGSGSTSPVESIHTAVLTELELGQTYTYSVRARCLPML